MTSHSHKRTLAEAKEIIARDYPAVADMLPDLVAWLSDQNSPGYPEIADFLLSIGWPVVPHVKNALGNLDNVSEWHCALLFTQVRHWPREWVAEIEEELNDLAWHGSSDWGVDTDAALLLAKNGLGDRETLLSLVKRKREGCYSRLKKLEEIEGCLQRGES